MWGFFPKVSQIYFNTLELSTNLLEFTMENSLQRLTAKTDNTTVNIKSHLLGTNSEMGTFPDSPVAKEHNR